MIIEKHHSDYCMCRIPGIVSTSGASLIAYYECRDSESDWAKIDIKLIKSTDGGKSWKCIRLIKGDGHTLNNPMIIVQGDVLHLLYCKDYKTLHHSCSFDDGITWTDDKDISGVFDGVKHTVAAIGPGHGIVTKEGAMVVPVWFAYNHEDKTAHKPSFIHTLYSTDNGNTWQLGESVDGGIVYNANESALALLNDGRVLISIRSDDPRRERCFAVSDTSYSGWTDLHFDPRFPDPMCMGSMTSSNGTLCHINCSTKERRYHLTLKYSKDDFKSIYAKEITGCGGYSDVCITGNTAHIIYEETIYRKNPSKENGVWDINLCYTTAELDFRKDDII